MTDQETLTKIKALVEDVPYEGPGHHLAFTAATDAEPAYIRALCEYSARTGHRILLDYRNPHGRHTKGRPVVVRQVRSNGEYVDANAGEGVRTFMLSRIQYAVLDGFGET